MTAEQLLQPRYKVIADYPESYFPIGSIMTLDFEGDYWNCSELNSTISHPDRFPAIFRKLEWWEERNIEDMPLFVKENVGETVNIHKVFYKIINGTMWMLYPDRTWQVTENVMCFFEPSTEAEYLTYKTTNQ